MKPQDYYFQLVRNGMSPYQAYQAVQASFGPPPSAQDRAKEQAKNQQMAAIAGTVGTVGGALATKYVLDNSGKWIDQLTGRVATPEIKSALIRNNPNATPGTVATTTPTTTGASAAAGSNLPNVPGEFNYQTPQFEYGKTVEIDTPIGKQQVPETIANDEGFLSSVNWNQVATGAITLLAAYQAYQSYKTGDKIGAGISGATAATGAASLAGSEMAAEAMPYLGAVAGAYQGYKTAEMIGDSAAGSQRNRNSAIGGAASGAAIGGTVGSVVPGIGTAVGAVVGAVIGGAAGLVGSWTGSHKGKAQFMRDNIRDVMKEGNILDANYQGTLADGSLYDFGKDGSHMKWKEIDKVAAANPNSWNSTVPLTDALAASYGLVGQKASDVSAWYAKAAVSNAQNDPLAAIANAQHFARQQGITFDLVKSKLDEALAKERINQNQYDYYLGGAQQLTAGIQPQPQQPPQQQKPWQQSNVQPMPRPRL
jgi:hypothetical protein